MASTTISVEEVHALAERFSNWGRWGPMTSLAR